MISMICESQLEWDSWGSMKINEAIRVVQARNDGDILKVVTVDLGDTDVYAVWQHCPIEI